MAGKPAEYWQLHTGTFIAQVGAHRDAKGVVDWYKVALAMPLRRDGTRPTTDALRIRYFKMVRDHELAAPAAPDLPPIPVAPPQRDPLELEMERQDRVRGLKEERDLLREIAGEKSMRILLETLFQSIAPQIAPPPKYRAPKIADDTVTETLVLHLSDWHAYENVSAERTRDFGEYSAKIFGERVRAIVERLLSIKRRMERGGGWRFPKLVVALNGDMVSGTIHEVERHSDAPNVIWAVFGCAHVLAAALRDLAGDFEAVEVFCTSGNHGRLPDARRMQQKDPTRSWDTAISLYAREMCRTIPQMKWYIPDSYSAAFDVEGWRFLQTHGHDVKSWNQIPHYGINRMVSNLNALEAGRGTPIHYFLFGHHHNKTSLDHAAGEWFINGSLIGATEFSVQGMGRADQPSQWLLGVHPIYGVSHRWPLVVRSFDGEGYDVEPWRTAA